MKNNNQQFSQEGKQKETMGEEEKMMKVEKGEYGYVLEDVPHLTDYIPDLPVSIPPSIFVHLGFLGPLFYEPDILYVCLCLVL